MVSTPFSLTETWSAANSLTVTQSSEALIGNVSANDLRWARSPDAAAPAFGPGDGHLLRPGRSLRVPLAAGQSLWLAGSAGARAIVDIDARVEPLLSDRADLVARVAGGWIRPDGEPIWAGGHAYAWSAGATVMADLPGLVPLAPFHGAQFGLPSALNDGAPVTGDYSAQLQAAHDYIAGPAVGGGTLCLGACKIGIGSTVYFGELAAFRLVGEGRGILANGKWASRATSETRLAWTGGPGEAMIVWTSDRADGGAADRASGGGMVDLHIDGQEVATYGVRVQSYGDLDLKIRTSYCTTAHFVSDTLVNGVSAAPADNQLNRWNIHCDDVNTGTEPVALVVINGNDTSFTNTSVTVVEELKLVSESTAVALHVGNCDATYFEYISASARTGGVGDGGKVIFHASDTLPATFDTQTSNRTRHIHIGFIQATAGFTAKAALGAGGQHAEFITIDHLARGNGAPLPVQEAYEGQITYTTSDGYSDCGTVRALLVDRLATVGGTADAIALTCGAQLSAVDPGTRVKFVAPSPNTGPVTIQLDQAPATAAKTVTGVDLPAGYIRAGRPSEAVFDGTAWIVERALERGSNANGEFVRHADGWMTCYAKPLLSYFDLNTLAATATYPAAFRLNTPIYPTGSVNTNDFNTNVGATMAEHTGGVQFSNIANTSVMVHVHRVPGGVDYVATDETRVAITVSGRWY